MRMTELVSAIVAHPLERHFTDQHDEAAALYDAEPAAGVQIGPATAVFREATPTRC